MKVFRSIKLLAVILMLVSVQSFPQQEKFTFVFMTDIHLQPEKDAVKGYEKAINAVNELAPDFVITGGDLIMDALGQTWGRADSLYDLYIEATDKFDMPVYNTLGNHEVFGLYEESGIDPGHEDYYKKMYEKRIGPRYQSFDHNGWHFIILDSVGDTEERRYKGWIDEEQIKWLKEDLEKAGKETPVVISLHIPLLTVFGQLVNGALEPNSPGLVVNNAKEVIELIAPYNVKAVLQGHLHYIEDIYVGGMHFITSGAVSARWWSGPNRNVEEGFMVLTAEDGEISWEYYDYGWEAVTGK